MTLKGRSMKNLRKDIEEGLLTTKYDPDDVILFFLNCIEQLEERVMEMEQELYLEELEEELEEESKEQEVEES